MRQLAKIVILLLIALCGSASAQISILTHRSIGQGWSGGGTGYMRIPIKNVSGGAMNVHVWDPSTSTWRGSTNAAVVGTGASASWTWSLSGVDGPADGVTAYVAVDLYKGSPSGDFGAGPVTVSMSNTYQFRVTTAGPTYTYVNVPLSVTATVTGDYGFAQTLTPSPYSFPLVELTGQPPTSSVGIFGWTGEDVFLEIEGPAISGVTLLASTLSAYSHSGIVSADVPDGSTYTARMLGGGPVVGSGVVAKESDGSFTLLILVTPPEATGSVEVAGSSETAGAATLSVAGAGMFEITIPASGGVVVEIPDPNAVDDGAAITVTRNGQVVGTGVVHKDSNGSFAELIVTAGEGNEETDPNDAVFELDVVSYEPGDTTFSLEIDGVTFTPEGGGTVTGDPVNGTRTRLKVKVPNESMGIDQSDYEWKATGQKDGKAVRDWTIVQGETPDVPTQIEGTDHLPVGVGGFRQGDVIVINQPASPPTGTTPPGSYTPDPEDIDYAKMRQAMKDGASDALKVSGGGLGGSAKPSTAQGDAGRAAASLGVKSLGQAAGSFGALPAPGVAPFSSMATTWTITLPVLGPIVLDSSIYGIWPGILRNMTLALLVWQAIILSFSIVKSGFAGR